MRDQASITIGEKTYTLTFPLGVMVRAEKLLGKSLSKIFTPEKGVDGAPRFPELSLENMIILFKLGLMTEHKEVTENQAEAMLSEFLSDGKNLVQQTGILYVILGKAMGFFRTELDVQKEMSTALKMMSKKKDI